MATTIIKLSKIEAGKVVEALMTRQTVAATFQTLEDANTFNEEIQNFPQTLWVDESGTTFYAYDSKLQTESQNQFFDTLFSKAKTAKFSDIPKKSRFIYPGVDGETLDEVQSNFNIILDETRKTGGEK